MKNKTTTYKWAYLPFVFSSAAILATQATAGPSGSQQYKEAKQVNSVNHEYVGGDHSIGFGVDDEGNVDAQFDAAISRSDEHRTGVGLWAGYDLLGDDTGVLGRGGQVNHAWVSKDASGRVTRVNKTFVAYDRNEAGHDKATVGYGQENEDLFWDGRVSKGLSGGKDKRTVGGSVVTDRAYDWGVGATVGKFLPDANARIRAGIDHEWSNKVGSTEKDARNTTLSAGIEKFFEGTGHSLSLDVAGSKNSGGYRFANDDDTDVTGRLGYKYDFGGASIYQPDRRYRRVRVEVPGKSVPAYKTVPVYAKKTIRTPYKQLVKSTMELEGQTFFKLNSAKLIPSAQTRLKQIAAQIRKTGYKGSIRITGNTCGLGDARYDQILSEKRAKEVRNFLIKNGFNPNHLIARGLGKGHPKYARTPDQDFKNRRVDIEYVSEKQAYKTGYKTEQKTVQTGTRKVQLPGAPGAPRVIWKTEAIPTSPAWIKRALNNTIKHDRNVNTYTTTYGNEDPIVDNIVNAANDTRTTGVGTAITIDVLANDDSDATLTGVLTQPGNGTATIVNGQIVYTPNPDFVGTDTFTYQVTDPSGNLATATVTVTVIDDVINAADDTASTGEGEPVTIDVLSNDDADATLTGVLTQPSNGTATIVNGEIVYTPNAGFNGEDSFTYEVTDPNGNITTATVTVTVEGGVKAANDIATTDVDQPVTIDVLDNDDSDATLTGVLTQPSNGTATIVNGQIVYTPNAGFEGEDTFTYQVTDPQGNLTTATVTVTVQGDVKAANDVATTDVDQPVTIDVLDNDDADATLTGVLTQPSNGTATIVNGEIVYTPNAGFEGEDTFTYQVTDPQGNLTTATVTVTVQGDVKAANDVATTDVDQPVTIDVLDNDDADATLTGVLTQPSNGTATIVNGQIVYTPNAGFEGEDTFTYQVTDPQGNLTTATVTVTVQGDVKAANDVATTDVDQPVTIDVLDNDDADATLTGVLTQPSNGTATIVNGQIVYTPNAGFEGEDTFTYQVTDPQGNLTTATVTVTVQGDVKAANDVATTDVDQPVTIDVLANDDSDATITRIVDQPANGSASIVGGQIVYTPNAGFEGEDTFTYEVTDPQGNLTTATVTVTVQGDVKAANDTATTDEDQPVTIDVLGNDDSDATLTGQLTQPANGSVSIVGDQIVYTPNAGFNGEDSFTYEVTDPQGNTTTATVTVTVNDVNKPPVAKDDVASTMCSAITIDVLDNDTDPDGDSLSVVSVDADSLMYGTVMQSGNQIIYTPSKTCGKGNTGVDNFSYTISDGNGNTDSANVEVTVKGVTHGGKTQANPDDALIDAGETVTLNVLANDTGNGLKIIAVDNPTNGSVTFTDSTVTYTPDAGFTGTDTFYYDIVDENGYNDAAMIIIDVLKGCVKGYKCN